jgi:pimeloyl-ACP methyl ester carboxylesterase
LKPALLLIPGMLNDASIWQHVLPLLPTGWTVRIANVLTQDSIKGMAEDAWQLIADLDKDQPLIVAGYSMGGYVAIDMLANDTGRIHAAALLSTSVLPETQESRVTREKTIAAMQANFPKVIEGILKFSTHEASQAVLDELRAMQLNIGSENAVRQIQALMGRSDHRAKLSTLRLPVALMCGEHDRVTPPDLTRHIQACMPHASTTWVPTGHMLPVQTPDAVSQCLASLWESTLSA